MGSVVVSDDVERFVVGSLAVNEAEKRNPVLVGMVVTALASTLPSSVFRAANSVVVPCRL